MELYYSIGNILTWLLLIAGAVLAFITIRRMIKGQLSLPRWAKILLSGAMILGLLITFLSLLPPLEVDIVNPLITTQTHVVASADPSESTAPATE